MPASATPFAKRDWVSLGKKWRDLPPRIKRAAKGYFAIPDTMRECILPAKDLSIQQMIDFTLPNPVLTFTPFGPASFFSRNAPEAISDAMLSRLRRLPIPPISIVKKLLEVGQQAWLDGFQSVRYIHLCDAVTTHFPLWVVNFWVDVFFLQNTVRKPWVEAKIWLSAEKRQKVSIERHEAAEDASAMLSALPWGSKKSGASDDELIHALWRYLGPHWTTGSMQNDMLRDLANRIAAIPDIADRFIVQTSALSSKIVEAYTTQKSDTYHTAQGFRWVRDLAD